MPDACVIYNPAAGRGRARRLLEAARRDLAANVALRPTTGPGHAEELAHSAVKEGFRPVIAAGGDGTVHEVANGILQTGDPEAVFSVWPVGSSNDYAFTLGLTAWWKRRAERLPKPIRRVDVGRIIGGGRERFFVNGMGLGFNGAVTLEARRIPWLRGMPLYGLALVNALRRHLVSPEMVVSLDGTERRTPTLALSVNLGQREGGFLLTPRARLDDGVFDTVHAGPLKWWTLIRLMPAMATGRIPDDHPRVWMGRAAAVTVRSTVPVRVHTDGEFFCQPADGITELRAEVLPAALAVETFSPDGGA